MTRGLRVSPQKRESILYSRVTEINKLFVMTLADTEGVSESILVDYILDIFREAHNDSKKAGLTGGIEKA